MISNLMYIPVIILVTILLHFSLRKYLHILQQCFYHISDFFSSIKVSKIYIPKIYDYLLFILMVLEIVNSNTYIKYLIIIFWCITAILKIINTKKNKVIEKKKFVVTNRIKILYSFCYLVIFFSFGIGILTNISYILLVLSMYKISSILIMVFASILSYPVIRAKNNRYVKEAKNILKEHKNLKIIGITGSYGKTSTKNIINAILSEKYSTVMTPKSYNTTLGVTKTIREYIKPYTEIFVCEMGASRLGDIKEICNFVKPDISVITSIGPQHLSTFKSIENIIKEKFQIVKMAKNKSISVLNVDNEIIKDNYKDYTDEKEVITYGLNSKNCYVKNISMSEYGSTFDIVLNNEIINIKTKLLGKHNIYNILCAVIIAKKLGMKNDEITKAVQKIMPIEHRLELKYMGNILALDDSFNSNPEGAKMAIECLCMFESKYRVLVTPGMVELGSREREYNKKLGKFATKCDFVILVNSNITKYVKEGLDELNYKNYVEVSSIYEAFDKLNELNSNNDLIALVENDLPDCYIN